MYKKYEYDTKPTLSDKIIIGGSIFLLIAVAVFAFFKTMFVIILILSPILGSIRSVFRK